jgi:hypothetical protein
MVAAPMTPADLVICDAVAGAGDSLPGVEGSAGIESSAYHNENGPTARLELQRGDNVPGKKSGTRQSG